MEQLSGQDASFLYAESRHAPLHVGSVAIYDQSTVPGGILRFREILNYNAERLHLTKTLRRKVVRVPFDIDHPYWVDDKDFDLEYHIRHIALPQPADWRQLYILASRILATPLDMSKPPWESYYVEGSRPRRRIAAALLRGDHQDASLCDRWRLQRRSCRIAA